MALRKKRGEGGHPYIVEDESVALAERGCLTSSATATKCPELNPVENVWQFMRDNWLSNRIFKSYADILDQCCLAWNRLVEQPWPIMTIGLRRWAHG